MFRHSLQHTAREPSLAKRFAVIVIAGLVATVGTVDAQQVLRRSTEELPGEI